MFFKGLQEYGEQFKKMNRRRKTSFIRYSRSSGNLTEENKDIFIDVSISQRFGDVVQ
jgi:hypothetical protein